MGPRLHNIRSDITFDIVQHTYIHGGLSLNREGTASLLARDARNIAHFTHAGSSHASRGRAEHGAFFPCAAVLVELEREPDEGFRASPAWSPSKGEEAKESEVVEKKTLSAAQGASQVVSEGA